MSHSNNSGPSYAQSLISEPPRTELPKIQSIISSLNLQPHPEGGLFAETDRDSRTVPNPFINDSPLPNASARDSSTTRGASTSIFYLLTPRSAVGHFHRNRARTVHTLHSGRGRYVVIHPCEISRTGKTEIEDFVVGHDLTRGEKLQWIVEGGRFKASYLLPDAGSKDSQGGLLISETVVPGFEFADHDFLTANGLRDVVAEDQVEILEWLLRKDTR